MANTKAKSTSNDIDNILNYVDSSKGLRAKVCDGGKIEILQDLDSMGFIFHIQDIAEVLNRSDFEGKPFLQLNFKNNNKVLLTETLIGFKPVDVLGLDMARLPKVVTTPDLKSVFEAIEESLGSDISPDHEVEVLKKVYLSILTGGEKIGFKLVHQRQWINRLIASKLKASA